MIVGFAAAIEPGGAARIRKFCGKFSVNQSLQGFVNRRQANIADSRANGRVDLIRGWMAIDRREIRKDGFALTCVPPPCSRQCLAERRVFRFFVPRLRVLALGNVKFSDARVPMSPANRRLLTR